MPQEIKTTLDFKNVGKIVNLPDGVDAQDAATVHQLGAISGAVLPAGGTTGQIIKKQSNTDYDVNWEDAPLLAWGFGGDINDQTDLISGGKILPSLLPALAITDTFVVASEAAMLALTAETGDIAVRTDETKTYILKGTDPSVLADWELLLTPTGGVVSVFGRSGAVTAQSGDYSFSLISGVASTAQGGAPAGGSTGYVLTKNSATDYDYGWAAASGGIDTSADYTWTGKHTYSKVLATSDSQLNINPTFNATANNQQLAAVTISPTFNTGAFTGVKKLGIYSTGAIYFNTGGGGDSIYMSNGGIIRGAAATNGGFNLIPSLDGTGTITVSATTFTVAAAINATGTAQNTLARGITINTGSDLLKSNAISLLGNRQTFDNINGLQMAWNYSGGSRENYIVSSATSTGLNIGNAGDIIFGYWIGGTGGGLTNFGGWKKTGSFLVGTTTDDSSAILNLSSTTKGFLPARMSSTQWNAIPSKTEGLQGWNNTDHAQMWYDGTRNIGFRYNGTKFQGYDGTSWIDLN